MPDDDRLWASRPATRRSSSGSRSRRRARAPDRRAHGRRCSRRASSRRCGGARCAVVSQRRRRPRAGGDRDPAGGRGARAHHRAHPPLRGVPAQVDAPHPRPRPRAVGRRRRGTSGRRWVAMQFSKWHALGNSYLVVEQPDAGPLTPARVQRLCSVDDGIGSDGVIEVTQRDERARRRHDLESRRLDGRDVGQRRPDRRALARRRDGRADGHDRDGGRRVEARMLNAVDTDTDIGEVDVGEPESRVDGDRADDRPRSGTRTPSSGSDDPTRDDLLRLGPADRDAPALSRAHERPARPRRRPPRPRPSSSGSGGRGRRARPARPRWPPPPSRSRAAGATAPSPRTCPAATSVRWRERQRVAHGPGGADRRRGRPASSGLLRRRSRTRAARR